MRCLDHAALALLAASASCTLRCGDNTFSTETGGRDGGGVFDGMGTGDGSPPLTLVDFAVGGCEVVSEIGCAGGAPLTLQFAPITSSPAQLYLWRFGDGTTSTEAAPSHTYRSPGVFTVSLDVAGPGGGLGESKADWVTVSAGGLGKACGKDDDCASGLCVCGEGDGTCAAPLAGRGLCAASCASAADCGGALCADLAPAPPASAQDWQRDLCVASCADGCAAGLVCRELLSPQGGWIEGCFAPGLLSDIGGSCVDASGAAQNSLCSSGRCLALGARGLCGADCAAVPCPASASCALFGGPLGRQCLRDCGSGSDCARDPWLACEAPGNGGALGVTVSGAPNPAGYCAPRFCGDDPADCDPAGACVANYCQPP